MLNGIGGYFWTYTSTLLQTLSWLWFKSGCPDGITAPSFLTRLDGPAGLPYQVKPAALSLHHCNLYQDILSWQNPFECHCIAMFCWTNYAQWGRAACAFNYLDLAPCNHLAANKAIPFLIKGVPLPELIESS